MDRRSFISKSMFWTFAVLGGCAGMASAQSTGAAFLEIPVGARPAAMGSAYSALATDVHAPTWNPAGLGFLDSTQVGGQHLSYLEAIRYEYGSAVYPIRSGDGIGVSAQLLTTGDITETNQAGDTVGRFTASYAAYTVAYGHRFGEKLSIGLAGKFIQAKLADVSANTYAADGGILYQWSPAVALSLVAQNIGPQLTFIEDGDDLPTTYRAAIALRPGDHWTLSAEGVYPKAADAYGQAGMEWRPFAALAIRAGYRTATTKALSPLAGLTTGIGVTVWGSELAYAWLPLGDLGNTQYFSFVLRFGTLEKREADETHALVVQQARKEAVRPGSKSVRKAPPQRMRAEEAEHWELMEILSDSEQRALQRATRSK